MRKLLFLLPLLCAAVMLLAQGVTVLPKTTILPNTTVFPGVVSATAPTIRQELPTTCHGTTPQVCSFGSNLLANDYLYVYVDAFSGFTSVTGCGLTWTPDTAVSGATQVTSSVTSAGACSVTATASSGNISIHGVEITGSTGIDVRGAVASTGSITSGNPFNCPNVSTTDANDLLICGAADINGNGGTYTQGTGFSIAVQGQFGTAIESKAQASTGSVTPAYASYGSTTTFVAGTIAFHP